MKTIRCRAWHTHHKQMFSADQLEADQLTLLAGSGRFINVSGVAQSLSSIISHEVMIPLEFTGMLDDNLKEIYDGDIIEMDTISSPHPPEYYHVGWSDRLLQWVVFYADGYCKPLRPEFRASKIIKVIGNRYENPNLLEKTK